MKGIYFINDKIQLNGLPMQESFQLQEEALVEFLNLHDIQIVAINPDQLNSYYTILHALLYDLKETGIQFDCLACYSQAALDDFINTYPARWLILKSYFENILPIHA